MWTLKDLSLALAAGSYLVEARRARTRMKVSDPFFVVGEAVRVKERQHGGLRPAARALRIDAAYLKRLRDGEKRDPGDAILRKLGLYREVVYRWLPSSQSGKTG